MHQISVVTGVSGSGKSTLIRDVLHGFFERYFITGFEKPNYCNDIKVNFDLIDSVEFINQNPIGKSSRSNPITYIKGYDDIRQLFSKQQHAKVNGFKPGHFSFNVDGGRCENAKGKANLLLVCNSWQMST